MAGFPAVKHSHYQDYRPEHTQVCEAALLTVWEILDDYRADLVIIGGLVPRYICKPPPGELTANTLDVDLGLAIAVRGTAHNRIATRLDDQGFKTKPRELPAGVLPMAKFYRQFGSLELCIEFLAERGLPSGSSVLVLDNMYVPTITGIGRAFDLKRTVTIAGMSLQGVASTQEVAICEIGPFLCLKLQIFAEDSLARAGKDAFDIIHSVIHYDGGAEKALTQFAAEKGVNPAFPASLKGLERAFNGERSAASVAYADFCMGGLRGAGSLDDFDLRYAQRAQEALLVGARLRQAAGLE